jgi:hypothetical protein
MVCPPLGIAGIVEFHSFWVDQEDDMWFGACQPFAVGSADRDADNHIDPELDINTSFPIRVFEQDIDVLLGYSHFFVGQFVEDANGVADDADEAIIMLTYEF